VFENRVLIRICGTKKEEMAGVWRRLHNEKLHNLYASLYIIRMIKSMRMRQMRHAAHMGEMRNA
jgi:NAD(P)H-nitrite reductase large subunit